MRLDQLRFFIAAAESGSISEAARRVHLAQPAFSAHIKALEHDLGVTLFLRSTRGVSLTAPGKRLYNGATALFRHVAQVRQETLSAGNEPSGDVRIVLAGSLAPLLAAGSLGVATLAVLYEQRRYRRPPDFVWPQQFDEVPILGVLAGLLLLVEYVRAAAAPAGPAAVMPGAVRPGRWPWSGRAARARGGSPSSPPGPGHR